MGSGTDPSGLLIERVERRQVFDISRISIELTEYALGKQVTAAQVVQRGWRLCVLFAVEVSMGSVSMARNREALQRCRFFY